MTISAVRGGGTIDLGQLSPATPVASEEVTVRMANSTGAQYQLQQLVSGALTNEQGQVLNADRLRLELAGGESGTAYRRSVAPLSASSMTLFTSGEAGRSDSLTLVYSLERADELAAGTYVGAITYTLTTVDGSAVDVATVPVRLVVSAEFSLAFAEGSSDRVDFGVVEPGQAQGPRPIAVRLANTRATTVQVEQAVLTPPTDATGHVLPAERIRVAVQTPGAAPAEWPLAGRLTLLPETVPGGPVDEVTLAYTVDVPEDQRAGRYTGQLQLVVRPTRAGGSAGAILLEYPVELEVAPVLALAVTGQGGRPPELLFTGLVPGRDSAVTGLEFDVRTNLGQAYLVEQELTHPLVSDEGRQLPSETLVCTAADAVHGSLASPGPVPSRVGRWPVYRSDPAGAPDRWRMSCQLKTPRDAAAGRYRSSIVFTLTPF